MVPKFSLHFCWFVVIIGPSPLYNPPPPTHAIDGSLKDYPLCGFIYTSLVRHLNQYSQLSRCPDCRLFCARIAHSKSFTMNV